MKVHFVSTGYAVPLAYNCLAHGASVSVYNKSGTGVGMFPVVDAPDAATGDAIVFDGLGWGQLCHDMTDAGLRCIGGGKWFDLMMVDPDYRAAWLARVGIEADDSDNPRTAIVGGWFDGAFSAILYEGVVYRRLLAGDLGASTPAVAAQLAPLAPDNPLVDTVLLPLEPALAKARYVGPVSVHIGQGGEPCGLSLGIQPQIIEALGEMCMGGIPALLSGNEIALRGDCAMSVGVSLPPWPHGTGESGLRLRIPAPAQRHVWPLDVVASPDSDELESAGTLGALLSVTARGRPELPGKPKAWFAEAAGRIYRTIAGLNIPQAQYRNDLGKP